MMEVRQEDSGRGLDLVELLRTRDSLGVDIDQTVVSNSLLPHLSPLSRKVSPLRTVNSGEEDNAHPATVVLDVGVVSEQQNHLLLLVRGVEEDSSHQGEYE